jgi:hypothetical protein
MKHQSQMPDPEMIERVERPTLEIFQQKYFTRSRPVIISGMMDDWKALSLWNAAYFKSVLGHLTTSVAASPTVTFNGHPKQGFSGLSEKMEVGKYIDLISNGGLVDKKYYLQQKSIDKQFPLLAQDIGVPEYIDEKMLETRNLWFGPAGNISPLHYDNSNNMLAQVSGRKRVTLFSPRQLYRLYPHSIYTRIPHLSRLNIEQPDFEKYPRFRKARAFEGILEPGEILFIPVFWWHQVQSLSMAISVNFWWKPSARQRLARSGLRIRYQHWLIANYAKLYSTFFKRPTAPLLKSQ